MIECLPARINSVVQEVFYFAIYTEMSEIKFKIAGSDNL